MDLIITQWKDAMQDREQQFQECVQFIKDNLNLDEESVERFAQLLSIYSREINHGLELYPALNYLSAREEKTQFKAILMFANDILNDALALFRFFNQNTFPPQEMVNNFIRLLQEKSTLLPTHYYVKAAHELAIFYNKALRQHLDDALAAQIDHFRYRN